MDQARAGVVGWGVTKRDPGSIEGMWRLDEGAQGVVHVGGMIVVGWRRVLMAEGERRGWIG